MKIYVYIVENRDVDYTNHKYSQSTHQTVLSSHCAPVFFAIISILLMLYMYLNIIFYIQTNVYTYEIALYYVVLYTIYFADTFLVLWL